VDGKDISVALARSATGGVVSPHAPVTTGLGMIVSTEVFPKTSAIAGGPAKGSSLPFGSSDKMTSATISG
jgi:hypothetical protein